MTATPYSVAIGLVNQLVTQGTSSARLAIRADDHGSPRRFSRQAITPRLIDVIAYDPSSPNANTLPSAEQLAAGRDHQQHRRRVITTIAPRGVPKRLLRVASVAGR